MTSKYMKLKILLIFFVFYFATDNIMAEFKEGQVWKYETRDGEESSLVYIVKIDNNDVLGNIYHLYIDGISIKNPYSESGYQDHIPHSPVDATTLEKSLTELVHVTSDPPDISQGYKIWKEALESGEGGVFNIQIKEIIQYIEEALNK